MLLPWLAVVHAGSPGWETLQNDQVYVACYAPGASFECVASGELHVAPERAAAVLEDIGRYPEVFASVTAATRVDAEHVQLDAKWPLGEARVTAKVEQPESGRWTLVRVPDQSHGPSLWDRAEWRIEPSDQGSTLSYRWSGERSWLPIALQRRVWRGQGHNAIWAIALAVDSAPDPNVPAPLRPEPR